MAVELGRPGAVAGLKHGSFTWVSLRKPAKHALLLFVAAYTTPRSTGNSGCTLHRFVEMFAGR